MGNIFETIKILSLSSKVGSHGTLRGADGVDVDCIAEAFSMRKRTATVSCEIDGQKYRIDLALKPEGHDETDGEPTSYPEAVYTVSGKLVYLMQ